MKLNIGAGRDVRIGWTNLDLTDGPGIDVVADLDTDTLPFDDDSVAEIEGLHVIEHLRNPMHAMSELWRIAEPDATLTLATPYGSSDDAWEDPTHVRPYYRNSWAVFGQPYHWRADYGYHADWNVDEVELQLDASKYGPGNDLNQLMMHVDTLRNIVVQMVATLTAVKPARARDRALLEPTTIRLSRVTIT